MVTKKAIGLDDTGIEIALYKEDGTAPAEADFVSWGKCYKDTAILETAEAEPVPCECEEYDEPEDEWYVAGATTLKFSTSDLDPASCLQTFGGTLAAGKWTAPERMVPRLAAVRFGTRSGKKVLLSKVKIATRINWAIKKNGYGLLEHTCKKLAGELSIAEVVAPVTPPPAPKMASQPLK